MALDGVNRMAEGEVGDEDCIPVFVTDKAGEVGQAAPGRLGGFPVGLTEIADIDARE